EIGPHPALKGPFTETISVLDPNSAAQYYGLLQRKENDVAAFTATLGKMWTMMGAELVDFNSFRDACFGASSPPRRLVRDLPAYPWDHQQEAWNESHISRVLRTATPRDVLLGVCSPDATAHGMNWRNVLSLDAVPWLPGHKFQSQILFPGTGYATMAV